VRTLVPVVVLTVASCGSPAGPASSKAPPFPLEAKLGQVVTVEGVPENAQLGALLMIGGARTVWIDGLDEWPPELRSQIVQVTGKVIERSDLPVFVHQDAEPERAGGAMGGVPVGGVPVGAVAVGAAADRARARRRFLLTGARWKVVE
jgi:hypothetical protein